MTKTNRTVRPVAKSPINLPTLTNGELLDSTIDNIESFVRTRSSLYLATIKELIDRKEWTELNDRFYRTLAFGTGGLRGRTIGKIVTVAERGVANENERPEFPCVGTNAMNYFNVSRATK